MKPVGRLRLGSANIGSRPRAALWKNCYRVVRNQGQICPKVSRTTNVRNTLRVPLTTIILIGGSIFLQTSKPRSLTESVPWWLTSCNSFVCAKYSLFYWGPVRKIMPGWNRSAVQKRLPTPGLRHVMETSLRHLCLTKRKLFVSNTNNIGAPNF